MCLELEPNNVFQSFSTNGRTLCPLIDDILAPCNSEDRKVKLYGKAWSAMLKFTILLALKFNFGQSTCSSAGADTMKLLSCMHSQE